MSRVSALSAGVDMRYALIVEMSTHSDPCVPTLCGGITLNTGIHPAPSYINIVLLHPVCCFVIISVWFVVCPSCVSMCSLHPVC